MNPKKEIKAVSVKSEKVRRKVREMEAFGWVLDDTEDVTGKKVQLHFWRPLIIPNLNKLRKLEYDLSRLPRETMTFNIKFVTGLLVCMLIAFIAASAVGLTTVSGILVGLVVFEVSFLLFAAIINPESKKLAKRHDRILHRARMLLEGSAEPECAVMDIHSPGGNESKDDVKFNDGNP